MISLYLTLSGREQMLDQHTDENHGAANVQGVFTLCRAAHTCRRQKRGKNNHLLAGEESSASNYIFVHSFILFHFLPFLYFVVEYTLCVCWGTSKKEQ